MNKKMLLFAFVAILLNAGNYSQAEVMFSGQADLNNVQNGSYNVDGNTCQINVNAGVAGATANWNTLNVPQGNALKFYFPETNQYVLNKVGAGATNLAGTVTYADGSQAGTVIFSNPNGININGTAQINLGSLLLTTHDVQMNGNVAKLTKQLGSDNNYHGITIDPKAQITLDNNLTITSVGNIEINDAYIKDAQKVVMLTADGLNYLTTSNDISSVQNATGVMGADIIVADSSIKTTDGKIILTNTTENGGVTLYQNEITSDVEITAFDQVVFDGEHVSYAPGLGYTLPNVIKGDAKVNAPKVDVSGANFNGKVEFIGLEEITCDNICIFWDDAKVLTKTEDMANSISEFIEDNIYVLGDLTVDVMPQIVAQTENSAQNNSVEDNVNYFSSYVATMDVNANVQPVTTASPKVEIQALAASDIESYTDEFLSVSVYEDAQGNLYTKNMFKGE